MTHIVTEACINCKYTDCVAVCPVDCFQQGKNMLVIDPEVCIDCGLCPSECPVEAIYSEDDLPENQEEFLEINAKYAHWPVIDAQQDAMDGADEAAKVTDKKHLINANSGP